jgi:hypothetical protein
VFRKHHGVSSKPIGYLHRPWSPGAHALGPIGTALAARSTRLLHIRYKRQLPQSPLGPDNLGLEADLTSDRPPLLAPLPASRVQPRSCLSSYWHRSALLRLPASFCRVVLGIFSAHSSCCYRESIAQAGRLGHRQQPFANPRSHLRLQDHLNAGRRAASVLPTRRCCEGRPQCSSVLHLHCCVPPTPHLACHSCLEASSDGTDAPRVSDSLLFLEDVGPGIAPHPEIRRESSDY